MENFRISTDEMDACHMEGRVRYFACGDYSKFFALVDKEQMYHLRSGGYVPLASGLEGLSE